MHAAPEGPIARLQVCAKSRAQTTARAIGPRRDAGAGRPLAHRSREPVRKRDERRGTAPPPAPSSCGTANTQGAKTPCEHFIAKRRRRRK